MRIITFIIATLIFSLSLLPCTDGQEALNDSHTEQHDTHGHSHDHEGDCPPFCSCSCCGVVLGTPDFVSYIIPFFKPVFVTEFHYSFYYSHDHPTIVWQPPIVQNT